MTKRKDSKGHILKTGESQRKVIMMRAAFLLSN